MDGPTGPKSKNLDRKDICQNKGICIVQSSLVVKLNSLDDDEEMPWPDQKDEVEVEVETGDGITGAVDCIYRRGDDDRA